MEHKTTQDILPSLQKITYLTNESLAEYSFVSKTHENQTYNEKGEHKICLTSKFSLSS